MDEERTQPTPAAGKRPYASPTVSRVELRPEEAVLGNCKNVTLGAGPGNSRCRTLLPACASIGS
jgi:hypothetical protein